VSNRCADVQELFSIMRDFNNKILDELKVLKVVAYNMEKLKTHKYIKLM
jgi:hypothetical protein